MEDRNEEYLLKQPVLWSATLSWAVGIAAVVAVVTFVMSGSNLVYTACAALLAIIVGGLILLPTLASKTTTLEGHHIVFNDDGNIDRELDATRTFWTARWLAYCRDYTVEPYSDEILEGAITLGKIDCWVNARAYLTPEGFAAQRKRFEVSSAVSVRYAARKKLRDYLLELQKQTGSGATFDDPKDPNQQEQFREYALDCLQPLANKDGISIGAAHFTL